MEATKGIFKGIFRNKSPRSRSPTGVSLEYYLNGNEGDAKWESSTSPTTPAPKTNEYNMFDRNPLVDLKKLNLGQEGTSPTAAPARAKTPKTTAPKLKEEWTDVAPPQPTKPKLVKFEVHKDTNQGQHEPAPALAFLSQELEAPRTSHSMAKKNSRTAGRGYPWNRTKNNQVSVWSQPAPPIHQHAQVIAPLMHVSSNQKHEETRTRATASNQVFSAELVNGVVDIHSSPRLRTTNAPLTQLTEEAQAKSPRKGVIGTISQLRQTQQPQHSEFQTLNRPESSLANVLELLQKQTALQKTEKTITKHHTQMPGYIEAPQTYHPRPTEVANSQRAPLAAIQPKSGGQEPTKQKHRDSIRDNQIQLTEHHGDPRNYVTEPEPIPTANYPKDAVDLSKNCVYSPEHDSTGSALRADKQNKDFIHEIHRKDNHQLFNVLDERSLQHNRFDRGRCRDSQHGKQNKKKTVMCKNAANCSYGQDCMFAHSEAELRHHESQGQVREGLRSKFIEKCTQKQQIVEPPVHHNMSEALMHGVRSPPNMAKNQQKGGVICKLITGASKSRALEYENVY